MHRATLLLSLLCLSLSGPLASARQDVSPTAFADTPGALIGRPSVYVVVEGLNADANAAGLSEAALQTDAEHSLKSDGVPVLEFPGLSKEDVIAKALPTGNTAVTVEVSVLKAGDDGPYIYSVDVQFSEDVKLDRPPHTEVFDAVTWRHGITGVFSGVAIRAGVRNAVSDLIKKLADDYLSASPKT